MLGGDDQVAGESYFEASTEGNAIYRRNNRLVALKAARDAPEGYGLFWEFLASGGCCSGCFKVVACREGTLSCSSQDSHPGLVILLEVVEDFAQFNVGCVVQG